MGACAKLRHRRQGFTLVEMLMVIGIISILASLLSFAAVAARGVARRTVVKTEMSLLDMALQEYRTEYGEFPPDFADINHPPAAIAQAARDRVIRHLRKAFPRYTPHGDRLGNRATDGRANLTVFQQFANDVYDGTFDGTTGLVDPLTFDAASGLVFWLGGLPEDPSSSVFTPAGFHTDRNNPFRAGGPRTEPFNDFDPERLELNDSQNRPLRFYPKGIEQAPYVYFRAVRVGAGGGYEYAHLNAAGMFEPLRYNHRADSICVPYIESADPANAGDPTGDPATERIWENPQSYQILTAGLDGEFGNGDVTNSNPGNFRFTKAGLGFSEDGGDHDNLTCFADGELEDQIK